MRTRVLAALAGGLAFAAGLGACASVPTPYGPAAVQSGYGFTEQRIERDRFVVRFRANAATSPEVARAHALRRAAEITLGEGYDWFQVVSRRVDEGQGGPAAPSVGVSVGGGGGSSGSYGGVGVGLNFPVGGGGEPTEAVLEVLLRPGQPAVSQPDAYNARAVLANLATP